MKKLKRPYFIAIISIIGLFHACQTPSETEILKEGPWRGVFKLPEAEIPFQFEAKQDTSGNTILFLINADDKFKIDDVKYNNDSVIATIDIYNITLQAKIDGNYLYGNLIRKGSTDKNNAIPFSAEYGKLPRFATSTQTPVISLTGTWDIKFGKDENIKNTVGIFNQKESLLTGSILTTTGDYRFLEGAVNANKFALSSFGGLSPYLLQGEFINDSTFTGKFITPRTTVEISGKKNPKAALPNAYNVTYLKEGYSTLGFSFPNLEGKQVSLSDPKYKNKVVIVTILGSWCPNCLDESKFLAQWYKYNHERGVEIIGLGFERKNDFNYASKVLTSLKNRIGIDYEILFAGQTGKENVAKALPEINGFASYPTTIFIDKKGVIRKIHSGFNGPATGKFYDEYKTEFNSLIDELLAEK